MQKNEGKFQKNGKISQKNSIKIGQTSEKIPRKIRKNKAKIPEKSQQFLEKGTNIREKSA